MPQAKLLKLHLSASVVSGGRRSLKTEVPGPNFITQGFSPRRDRVYLNERVRYDVQAAFLGCPSADALIKAAGYMTHFVDPRAPADLPETEAEMMTSIAGSEFNALEEKFTFFN